MVPADFEDFSKKVNLDALFKLLLKPAKEVTGPAAAPVLTEVASYVIPAKSQIGLMALARWYSTTI